MPDMDLDSVLSVLENPTRRKILHKLVKEVHYPLQLSKELNVSQQAIMKHLKVLEDNGLVESFEEKSDAGGPPRKCYRPTKNFSIRIDFGPNTFNTRMVTYRGMTPAVIEDEVVEGDPSGAAPGGAKGADEPGDEFRDVLDDFHQVMETESDEVRLSQLVDLVREIDARSEELDARRGRLLMYREAAMREVNRIVMALVPSYESRRVIYYILDESRPTMESMAESLDLREKVLRDIFMSLRRKSIFFDPFGEDD